MNRVRPQVVDGLAAAVMLTPASWQFSVARVLKMLNTATGNAAWPGTSFPIALPFWLSQPATVYQIGWLNGGGTMTDSTDIGIYDSALARIVSTGSTARSGASALQFVDIADTALAPGKYYVAVNNNGTTANQASVWAMSAVQQLTIMGVLDKASADFALPATLSSMVAAATFTFIPSFYLSLRAIV